MTYPLRHTYQACQEEQWMTPRQAPRTLLIILAMAGLWAAYLLLQRPLLRSRGVDGLDLGNVVGFPLLIVAMYMVSRYLLWRNNPMRTQDHTRHW